MRIPLVSLIALTLVAPALAQTPAPPATGASNSVPHGPIPPKPPAKPKSLVPEAASGPGTEAQMQVAMFKAAQDAQEDLKSLMASIDHAKRVSPAVRPASSNPCGREGKGATIACLDRIGARTAEMQLTSEDRYRLDQQLAIFRDAALAMQAPGTASQRAGRLTAARTQASELDKLLTELARAKPPKPQQALTLPGLGGVISGLGN